MNKPLTEKQLSQIARGQDGACWPWLGTIDRHGYGVARVSVRWGSQLAHRFVWEIANCIDIPHGMFVCHSCDNPPCCNPKHLWLGTHMDNMQDCVRKGRICPPERKGNAKLTSEKARFARTKYAAGAATQSDLARRLGVSLTTIFNVVHGRTWKPRGEE